MESGGGGGLAHRPFCKDICQRSRVNLTKSPIYSSIVNLCLRWELERSRKLRIFWNFTRLEIWFYPIIHHFMNLTNRFYPIISVFSRFFPKNKTQIRRPTITVCMVGQTRAPFCTRPNKSSDATPTTVDFSTPLFF